MNRLWCVIRDVTKHQDATYGAAKLLLSSSVDTTAKSTLIILAAVTAVACVAILQLSLIR